jgi:hypothetical protein
MFGVAFRGFRSVMLGMQGMTVCYGIAQDLMRVSCHGAPHIDGLPPDRPGTGLRETPA